MITASFGDPGEERYEVYLGPLGHAVFVRCDGRLIGVVEDQRRAMTLIRGVIADREAANRHEPSFYMAA
jgi:hypothetical protein